MKTGDRVAIECEGRTVDGTVLLASEKGRSLMVKFEAILAGHVGMMPLLADDAGDFRSIINGALVRISLR